MTKPLTAAQRIEAADKRQRIRDLRKHVLNTKHGHKISLPWLAQKFDIPPVEVRTILENYVKNNKIFTKRGNIHLCYRQWNEKDWDNYLKRLPK
jgi:hypothetical protein